MDARSQQAAAQAAAQTSQIVAQGASSSQHVDQRLSARFQSILAESNVSVDTQNKLAIAAITTPALFGNSADTPQELNLFLADMIGLDPSAETDPSARAVSRGELMRLRCVHATCKIQFEVETKANSERVASFLPLRIQPQELRAVRTAFEKAEFKLTDESTPSQAYFERKASELDSVFEAEALTKVTTLSQEDSNASLVPSIDDRGMFKVSAKQIGVALPTCTESLRARLRTLALCSCFVKSRAPDRRVLQSVTITRWDRYQEWLYSPDVWGMCVRDDDGFAISSPTIKHVIAYDLKLRQEVARLMNEGTDWHSALMLAQRDSRLMQNSFLFPVSIAIASHECKQVSAPNVLVRHSRPTSSAKAIVDSDPSVKKGASKQAKKKAKALLDKNDAAKFRAKGSQLALEDRKKKIDKGDKGGKDKGKGKEGLKLPAGILSVTKDGKGICHKHNLRVCNYAKCNFAHVCWWCEDAKHNGQQCPTHPGNV